jgi:cytochrome c oxidase cbb3-type subunit III
MSIAKTMSWILCCTLFATLGSTPAWAADSIHRPDQTPGSAEQIAQGKTAYAMCAGCHGMEGEGRVGVAPRLNSKNYLAAAPNDFFAETIKKGRAGTNMIAFGAAMQPEQVDALVAYIRDWQTEKGVSLDQTPLTGTVEQGTKLWADICSRCHGMSAAGYSEAGSGTGIGRKDFLDVSSDGFLRALIKTGKDNTPMRSFSEDSPVTVADLTSEEIDSIIKYLRSNAW